MSELCPTCSKPVLAVLFGRPRRYCSADCRREMVKLRRDLTNLETMLVDSRYKAETHYDATWRDRYQREVAYLEPRVAAARERVPEDLQ